MFEGFHQYINSIIPFTDKEMALVENACTFRQVPRKFMLAEEGKIAREMYFIVKGLLRLYYNKDGQDITGYIFKEHLFAGSYDSFLRQVPGIQFLETLEESDLLVITREALYELYNTVPKFQVLGRMVAEQRFVNAQMILSSFILDSPEERYRKFEATSGDLLLRVPHHIIASFLGITPVSMSRIRKRMMK